MATRASGGDESRASEMPEPPEDELTRLRRQVQELEAALERKALLLQAMVDHLPGSSYARDLQGRVIFVNRSAAEFLDREPAEFAGRLVADFFPREVEERWHEIDTRVVTTGKPFDLEEMVPREEGPHLHRSSYFPVFDGSGAVWAVGGISIDISAERQTEEARRRSEALLTSILAHVPLIIASMNAEGMITSLRGKIPTTMVLTPEQIIGRSIEDLSRDTPHVMEQVRAAYGGVAGHTLLPMGDRLFEMWFLPDDRYGPALREVVALGIDVTEQRRAEAEQQRLAAEFIEAQQSAIRALSAPIIPITENALAVPIVGRIDDARASQIMESLLQGVVARRARFAIVDVTGVISVDMEAAAALVRLGRAVRLLGAEVVMTGIGPEMARTLLETGVELAELVVLASLQDGIAYAITAGKA